MVATTFAADTRLRDWIGYTQGVRELAVVELSSFGNDDGLLFARMWRRSGLITDVQFAEFRYSGKPAAFLRGFVPCISDC